MSTDYKHGDVIEYRVVAEWRKGIFVAKHPNSDNSIIHITSNGHVSERFIQDVRKPKVKKEGWVNIYRENLIEGAEQRSWRNAVYESKEEGERVAQRISDYIATVKIEWEE